MVIIKWTVCILSCVHLKYLLLIFKKPIVLNLQFKEPVKSFVSMIRKMKISLYDN